MPSKNSNMFAGADKLLFAKAGELRKRQTFAEELLWQYLKTKPLGFKFRRQHAYWTYILDFYCHALKLVIEVDGSIHNEEEVKKNDEIRQKHLENDKLFVLRFTNDEIRLNKKKVIKQIENFLRLNITP
jgi:very-short-patch-repair endonuclease